jgi:hypothetical protein
LFSISPGIRAPTKKRNSTEPPPGYSWTIRDTSSPIFASIPVPLPTRAEAHPQLFAFFNLAAGKFPFQRHGLMSSALTHQNLSVLKINAATTRFMGRPTF